MSPPPRVALVQYRAGVHGYEKPEEDLPRGVLPAVLGVWRDAIANGFYVQ